MNRYVAACAVLLAMSAASPGAAQTMTRAQAQAELKKLLPGAVMSYRIEGDWDVKAKAYDNNYTAANGSVAVLANEPIRTVTATDCNTKVGFNYRLWLGAGSEIENNPKWEDTLEWRFHSTGLRVEGRYIYPAPARRLTFRTAEDAQRAAAAMRALISNCYTWD